MIIPIYYLVPIWGDYHTDTFLTGSLPTQISEQNFSKSTMCEQSRYIIYTTKDSHTKISTNESFKTLQSLIRVDFYFIEEIFDNFYSTNNQYLQMSSCHNHGIALANKNNAACAFWAPDHLYADGCVRNIKKLLEKNKKVIFAAGIRTNRDEILYQLNNIFSQKVSTTISPRELVKLTLENLHENIALSSFWEEKNATKKNPLLPSNLFWPVGNDGIVCHAFHLHPLVIFPEKKNCEIKITVDADYVEKSCPDFSKHHIVQDSDEIYFCELSKKGRIISGLTRENNQILTEENNFYKALMGWIDFHTTKHHLKMVTKKFAYIQIK
jgi:hypothetical protein